MKTTTNSWGVTETYMEAAEVANVENTIYTMLNDMRTAVERHEGTAHDNQIVLQLNRDERDGEAWKMFVYYDYASQTYYCSFQNENYYDTDFDRGYKEIDMAEHIMEEIEAVGGFEWIARDEN